MHPTFSINDVPYRQGDVPLAIAHLPKSATRVNAGKVILAYGEATGHHHRFECGAVLYADGDDRYVEIPRGAVATIAATSVEAFDAETIRVHDVDGTIVRLPADQMTAALAAIQESNALSYPGSLLRHEEHDAIVVAPGVYKSPGQREYTSADMEPIRVAD